MPSRTGTPVFPSGSISATNMPFPEFLADADIERARWRLVDPQGRTLSESDWEPPNRIEGRYVHASRMLLPVVPPFPRNVCDEQIICPQPSNRMALPEGSYAWCLQIAYPTEQTQWSAAVPFDIVPNLVESFADGDGKWSVWLGDWALNGFSEYQTQGDTDGSTWLTVSQHPVSLPLGVHPRGVFSTPMDVTVAITLDSLSASSDTEAGVAVALRDDVGYGRKTPLMVECVLHADGHASIRTHSIDANNNATTSVLVDHVACNDFRANQVNIFRVRQDFTGSGVLGSMKVYCNASTVCCAILSFPPGWYSWGYLGLAFKSNSPLDGVRFERVEVHHILNDGSFQICGKYDLETPPSSSAPPPFGP